MTENRKMEFQNLSAQELYDNFQECLEEMINRGMSVYYQPTGSSENDHLGFPVKSIENMMVFNSNSYKTDVNIPADNDGLPADNDMGTVATGWKYHDFTVESDGAIQNIDGSDRQEDPTNLVQNVQIDNQNVQQNQVEDTDNHTVDYGITDQEAVPIVAQTDPAILDYGTFPITSEESSNFSSQPTSLHPNSSVPMDRDENDELGVLDLPERIIGVQAAGTMATSNTPQCEPEKWEYAVLVTENMMINYPHSKYFPECNFNPNGPRLVVPQTVEAVPTGQDIQKFLKTKGIKECPTSCSNLSKSLRATQKELMKDRILALKPAASRKTVLDIPVVINSKKKTNRPTQRSSTQRRKRTKDVRDVGTMPNGRNYHDGTIGNDGTIQNDNGTLQNDQSNLDQNSQSVQQCTNVHGYQPVKQNKVNDTTSHTSNGNVALPESVPIVAQAAPAVLDYGTFPLTSHHPDPPVRSIPSPPKSKEEKWAEAAAFAKSEMEKYPYCKYFPQCFFNPDGPKYILPQNVELVPTAVPICQFLKQKGIKKDQNFCIKIAKRLKIQQGYMMDRRFVTLGTLGKLSSPGKKRSASPIPRFDEVEKNHADWKKKLESRKKF